VACRCVRLAEYKAVYVEDLRETGSYWDTKEYIFTVVLRRVRVLMYRVGKEMEE
jgi:hypothetical protein